LIRIVFLFFCGLFVLSCSTAPTKISRQLPERIPATDQLTIENNEPAKDNDVKNLLTTKKEKDFDWPVDQARMTRGFMPHKRRPHWGIDLAAPKNTTIFASKSGTVIYLGRDFRGFGKMILIDSGNGWATLYAHLEKYYIEQGQKVSQGEPIGAMGKTGRATGVHLHFEIRKDKTPVDPLDYLPIIAQR
jgi:murein DD-endopeptidase MepM/ murein hydrolase activator NlpD